MPTPIVQVEGLRKTYGAVVAAEDVSFEVLPGEIFGMVGPNGAGKTTTIECVEGLRRPDRGRVSVLGLDPQAQPYALRERIGIQLQEAALQKQIKVGEALDLFGSFYPRHADRRGLLDLLNLAGKEKTRFGRLSGGQKQRLFIALALLNDPELVFFDELTTGLDPQARHAMWDLVRDIRGRGKTVFLTTHFMEEAENLCDRVAIVDNGRIVALDTPENLIRRYGPESRLVFSTEAELDASRLLALDAVSRVESNGRETTVYGTADRLVPEVVNCLAAAGCQFKALRFSRPNLEDVFLALTGKTLRN